MADSLKSFFSRTLVRRLAADVARVHPAFPIDRFVRDASSGLEGLELLDRGRHIARALAAHLPPSYPDALHVLLRSLGPEHAGDESLGAGMAPFFYFPHTVFIAEHGLEHFDLSLQAQHALTKRFSAEWSIRPYIARDPERTFATLLDWTRDSNPHVRRLVSEGTRLRLPWGPRVAWLDAHPNRVVDLLGRLKDDESSMVRRSVANNLNDIGKAHFPLLERTAASWLDGASPERRALIEHALRSAVKRGEPGALRLLGYGGRPDIAIDGVRITPRRVAIGGRVAVQFTIRSLSSRSQELLVDLAVHFVKADGRPRPKVFKVGRTALPARGEATLSVSVSLAVHTTRKPQPGRHLVEVIVNGLSMPVGAFLVTR